MQSCDRLLLENGFGRARMRTSWMTKISPSHFRIFSTSLLICVARIVLVTGNACLAQVAGGTISGRVIDSSGGAIAGARVAVKNSETAILRSVDADSDGIYTAPNLVPGRYEISASRKGFATVV